MELMFDIETLDVLPSAAVLSLGAVMFERDGTIVDRFYRVMDISSQIALGRTASPDTLAWWMKQDKVAFDEAFNPVRHPVASALGSFYGWAKESVPVAPTKFWANGPNFDGTILESLARDFSCVVPWKYNQLRDQRTIVDVSGLRYDDFQPEIVGVAHTPVYDCEYQVAVVTECRRLLGKNIS